MSRAGHPQSYSRGRGIATAAGGRCVPPAAKDDAFVEKEANIPTLYKPPQAAGTIVPVTAMINTIAILTLRWFCPTFIPM